MTERQRRPGAPIARGNTSDIYTWTEATVVKVLRPDIPRQWASIEADITRRVHAAGLPVPATEGVVDVDGRPGVILERVAGPTMWQRMREAPAEVPRLIDSLAGLQTELHATTVRGLPDLARRLGSKIDEAVQVSASERQEAQVLLSTMPRGSALCHGDVHPANIVITGRGMVILDWFDAATGQPAADHVRSSLLMRPSPVGAAQPAHLDGATSGFLDWIHASYLAAIARRGLVELDGFARWEAVVAVARMSEPVPSDDLVELWSHWRAEGPGAAAAMIQRCLERAARPGVLPA
jgi:aminoglycoside phosphotransferase (APT) family kinase protein